MSKTATPNLYCKLEDEILKDLKEMDFYSKFLHPLVKGFNVVYLNE